MSKFFAPNLQRNGRIVRAVLGGLLLVVGVIAIFSTAWVGLVLLASAAFTLYEALRGWCVMRACGIKTKL